MKRVLLAALLFAPGVRASMAPDPVTVTILDFHETEPEMAAITAGTLLLGLGSAMAVGGTLDRGWPEGSLWRAAGYTFGTVNALWGLVLFASDDGEFMEMDNVIWALPMLVGALDLGLSIYGSSLDRPLQLVPLWGRGFAGVGVRLGGF